MKKICVLGGSGLIGNRLLEKGKEKFNMITTYNKNSISVPSIKSKKISLPNEFNSLSDYIIQEKPDIVIDTIAYSNPEFCEKNKSKTYELHVENIEKICKVCQNLKLIFLSTDYVFDGEKGKYAESDLPNPINYYGKTKLEAEKTVLKNPKNIVVRTSLIYGWKPQIRFLNFVVNNLLKNKEIYVWDDVYFSPTLLDEVVEGILKLATSNIYGLFHIAGSTCLTKFQFACLIARKFNLDDNLVKPISIKETQIGKTIPKNTCLNSTKIKQIINLKLSNIDEGLKIVFNQSRL